MKLEIGYEFKKNGIIYSVIDIIDYNEKSYCFLSEESDLGRIDFHFYEYSIKEEDIDIKLVSDDELITQLLKA